LYLTTVITLKGNPLSAVSYLMRGDEMNKLKGWPFRPIGEDVTPLGGGGPGDGGHPE